MIGFIALALVIMHEAGSQLARLEADGRAFGASVFTGFHPRFWETADFVLAERQWGSAEGFDADNLVLLHVLADAVFLLVYPMLIVLGLRRLGVRRALAHELGFFILVGDLVETAGALVFLVWFEGAAAFGGGIVQAAGMVKWIALSAAALVAVHGYLATEGGVSAVDTVDRAESARQGQTQEPWTALAGVSTIVAVFVLIVAVPAGGPLEQFPDVLRSQLDPDRGDRLGWFLPSVAVMFAVGAVGAAGFIATAPGPEKGPRRVERGRMVAASLGVGLALWVAGGCLEGSWTRFVPWAAALVVVIATVAACVVDRARAIPAGGDVPPAVPMAVSPRPWLFRVWRAVAATIRHCLREPVVPLAPASVPGRDPSGSGSGSSTSDPTADQGPYSARMVNWVAALAGVVATAAALGLVRAALLPAIYAPVRTQWIAWAAIAAILTVTGGWVTRIVVERLVDLLGGRLAPMAARVGAVALIAGAVFAVRPDVAPWVGANGVLAFGVAAMASGVASLAWLGNRALRWDVPTRLGWGVRTPWLTVLVTIWAVASFLDSAGGYHDARLVEMVEAPSIAVAAAEDGHQIDRRFEAWLDEPECTNDGITPLYLVAAPGGGIRAAYWTTSALEALFGPDSRLPCPQLGPFAVSGVSGGSVGTATWLATTGTDTDPTEAVAAMSEDRALAQAIAGLLFRDMPQSFVGLTDTWADRAELIERAWIEDEAFGVGQDEILLTELGSQREGWQPIAIFNGTSVNDGCRTLLSNVAGLTADQANCRETPSSGARSDVPFASAIGFSANLADPDADCGTHGTERAPQAWTVPAVTAAFTSARFPYVTPSAALYRCIGSRDAKLAATYVVDGGYAENSGLLSLLGVWENLEPRVRAHNAENPDKPIEPWIILLDNHYRSSVGAVEPTRPKEVFVPLLAFGAAGRLTPEALEQAATFEMSQTSPRCTVADDDDCRSTFLRIAPIVAPGPSAPLGWVLSETSIDELDRALEDALADIPASYDEFEDVTADPDRS